MKICVLFLPPWRVGGTITCTIHIANMLGVPLVRAGKRISKPVDGYWDKTPLAMSWWEMFERYDRVVVSIPRDDYPDILYNRKTRFALHDLDELRKFPRHWMLVPKWQFFTLRPAEHSAYPHTMLCPQPYERVITKPMDPPILHAISHCQFNSTKNGMMLLDANMLLPKKYRICIAGEPHRTFVHFAVKKKYPDFEDYKGYEKTWGAGAYMASTGYYNVDLTAFKHGSGGHTSYTLFEAMDAGAIPIIHKDWAIRPGEAKNWALTISSVSELVAVLKAKKDEERDARLRSKHRKVLRAHSYNMLRPVFHEMLGR